MDCQLFHGPFKHHRSASAHYGAREALSQCFPDCSFGMGLSSTIAVLLPIMGHEKHCRSASLVPIMEHEKYYRSASLPSMAWACAFEALSQCFWQDFCLIQGLTDSDDFALPYCLLFTWSLSPPHPQVKCCRSTCPCISQALARETLSQCPCWQGEHYRSAPCFFP